ncbi:MAG: GNAT family N-acetyltransferase [Candidatus Wallacebacter cryptica]|jgi:GNAT superfamily N-acetyltransferase|nr:GNAT family N-acetyltransferase [Bacillota bacterium]
MDIKFTYIDDPELKESICRKVLFDLPLWFGIPEANEHYAQGVRAKPFVAVILDGNIIGFASIKETTKFTAELYLIGLMAKYHWLGIGTRLISFICKELKLQGYKLLQVKTLDETRESAEYEKSRRFYTKVGFIPVEAIKEIWGPENPCLIMVKVL